MCILCKGPHPWQDFGSSNYRGFTIFAASSLYICFMVCNVQMSLFMRKTTKFMDYSHLYSVIQSYHASGAKAYKMRWFCKLNSANHLTGSMEYPASKRTIFVGTSLPKAQKSHLWKISCTTWDVPKGLDTDIKPACGAS